MINNITIDGKIVSDISLRQSNKTQTPVSDFRICQQKRNKGQTISTFVDVEAWGNLAERIYNNALRGNFVVISGSLRQDIWDDKEGNRRTKLKITANAIEVLDRGFDKGTDEEDV